MTRYNLLLAILFSSTVCLGQGGEFKVYPTGLIYSDTTMKQLELIVDSLNLKFRTCELEKVYYSKYQAKAHYINLAKGKAKEAKKDMENNISFNEFIKKYPQTEEVKNLLVVKFKHKNYEDIDFVQFGSIPQEYEINIEEKPGAYNDPVKGTWVYKYWSGSEYSKESISAFFFTTEFEKQPLPETYARMILYSECMVDTSAEIYKEWAVRKGNQHDPKKPSGVVKFMDYVHKETKRPKYDERDDAYWNNYQVWDSIRVSLIDSVLSKEKEFANLLNAAIADALENGGSDDEFEEYVGRYYSRSTQLELKRGRTVFGQCSMDDSPRIHAMNIAVLSAETINWEIFLRAHLDIMNDRFERASDGSYAWAGRKTYIRELEELEINVPDLLLGISFRIENPGENHYYGSINRLGRALSETKYADEIEVKMLEIIKDNSLDDYNRLIIYYLFLNYNSYLDDEGKKKTNSEKLNTVIEELPEYLVSAIKKSAK